MRIFLTLSAFFALTFVSGMHHVGGWCAAAIAFGTIALGANVTRVRQGK